ncbi:MAG: chromosomal replication initiator protein DnaA [Gemmatimonadales bacterium]|nr:MAG: chromosomal replication initiator protein DnaA [Gemmatimonadales bacterium]
MELTPQDLWSQVLDTIRSGMPDQSFRTWLVSARAVGMTEDQLLVEAPTQFHAEWVEDKYGQILAEVLESITGRRMTVSFEHSGVGDSPPPMPDLAVEPEAGAPAPSSAPRTREPAHERTGSALNERYTFEKFVVGSNNQLSSAAARAVAENPARMYNPLFLYGGVGLGKTHLMHAIGHGILHRDPGHRVAYVTSEYFVNELVNAIQTGSTQSFRRRFRKIDLLLVDDVQFMVGKMSTQEEFFHTFNSLYDDGKQIVLTSDRSPKDLQNLEARLVSRFEWGLVADINPPDYETRVAILRKKAEDDNLTLDDEVIDFIARSCRSSVRELEGATLKLLAYSSLRREEITVDLARQALRGILRQGSEPGGPPRLTPESIGRHVAADWNVEMSALASRRRTKNLTVPRQVAMFLIRELLEHSLVDIGRAFGGRDHSTVIHSVRKVEGEMEEDPEFAARVMRLRSELEAR